PDLLALAQGEVEIDIARPELDEPREMASGRLDVDAVPALVVKMAGDRMRHRVHGAHVDVEALGEPPERPRQHDVLEVLRVRDHAALRSPLTARRLSRLCGSSAARVRGLLKPAVGPLETLAQRGLRPPAELMEPAYVEQLARGAVRLAGIVDEAPLVADHVCKQFRDLANGDVRPGPDVDVALAGVVLHEEDERV